MRREIKICGLRSPGDARALNCSVPDYAGLVFAPGKRQVDVNIAREIMKELDSSIKVVFVLVNLELKKARLLREELSPDVLQLHGDETVSYMEKLGGSLWKTVAPGTPEEDISRILDCTDRIVVDSGNSLQRGGTGRTFDWTAVPRSIPVSRLVLAGGINCHNIRKALEKADPGCIDVSSGAENDAGNCKDPERIKQMVKEVHSWV